MTGTLNIYSPATESNIKRGIKAATVVRVDVKIGIATSLTPPMQALSLSSPLSNLLWIASEVTMALSTNMPRAIMRADMEI